MISKRASIVLMSLAGAGLVHGSAEARADYPPAPEEPNLFSIATFDAFTLPAWEPLDGDAALERRRRGEGPQPGRPASRLE